MQIRGDGLMETDGGEQPAEEPKVVYVLHPNCAVEEM